MKLKYIKKIEIALFLFNLLLFFVVNIFFMRKFHPVFVALMAIPVLIGLLVNAKKEYVKWEKKAPSILPFLVIVGICILCAFISSIPLITGYIFAVVFLIEILCAVLAIIVFLRYIITYNMAYKKHRKELELTRQQKLMNSSVSAFCILGILLVWMVTISYADRVAVVTSPEKYEKEISGTPYHYFPSAIPDGVINVKFYHFPGFWLANAKAYVVFTSTGEYINEYEREFAENVIKVTDDNPWLKHSDTCCICTYLEDHCLNQGKCDIYIAKENRCVQGYAINRETNEIFIFYDGCD